MPTKPLTAIAVAPGPEAPGPQAFLPPLEDRDALRTALGMPPDAVLAVLRFDEPEDWQSLGYPVAWQDYGFELVGTPALPTSPPEAPRFVWSDMRSPERHVIIAWRRRLYVRGTPLYIETRWHPETGETNGMVWPSNMPLKTADKHRATALKVLREVEKRGRPPGPDGFTDAQEFEDMVVYLIRVADSTGQGIKKKRIAALLRVELDKRRGDTGSAASVDVNTDSTERLITKHCSCKWSELVKKLGSPCKKCFSFLYHSASPASFSPQADLILGRCFLPTIKIDLDPQSFRRLSELAVEERRPIPWQAEVLLLRVLAASTKADTRGSPPPMQDGPRRQSMVEKSANESDVEK